MESIYIKEFGYTPGVELDKEKGRFRFTGKACPEDAPGFYAPIFDFFKEYLQDPLRETVLEFKLSYFNSASSKVILSLLQNIKTLNEGGYKASVKWYYYEDDEELYYSGEDFKDIFNIPFELIPIKE